MISWKSWSAREAVGGGGQPIPRQDEEFRRWGAQLHNLDEHNKLRYSHENPQIQRLYKEFLGKPLSEKAEELLRTQTILRGRLKRCRSMRHLFSG